MDNYQPDKYLMKSIYLLKMKFPNMFFRYEYNKSSSTHFIEVSPSDVFDSNIEYIKEEEIFCQEFEREYPYECLAFIKIESLYKIRIPTFII